MSFFSSSSSTPVQPTAPVSIQPPAATDSQRRAMTHLLPSMLTSSRSSGGRRGGRHGSKRKGRKPALAREGQAISITFNEMASRPLPAFTRLAQEITATMQFTYMSLFTTSTTVSVASASNFQLSAFANYAEYVGLFDQYRIDQIEVWLEPVAAQGSTVFNQLVSAVDLDDSTSPAAAATLLDKQGALTTFGGAGHYHRWRPHVAIAEYAGAFTSYGNVPSTWVDCASPNVQHYGFKAIAAATTAAVVYSLAVRAVVSFRAPGI